MMLVDVIAEFLLPCLTEEVYINIPDGYECKSKTTKFLRLLKTLYGLKQSPYMWNKQIATWLIETGLVSDRCVFVGKVNGIICYILLYVDDISIGTPNRAIMSTTQNAINKRFPITDK
jgi:hypothetical protein